MSAISDLLAVSRTDRAVSDAVSAAVTSHLKGATEMARSITRIPVTDLRVGHVIVDPQRTRKEERVNTLEPFSEHCSKRGWHVNDRDCYDKAGTVLVLS